MSSIVIYSLPSHSIPYTQTIWDVFSHIKNKTYHGDTGDDADKSYDLYAEDVKLLQQLNVQSYRFSIAWSRIITEDGEVNEAGVAHYVRILQLLRTANIKPVVTLYHWDLPVQFSTMSADSQSHYRGWLDRSIVDPFVLYAKVCFERFSPYVFRWITFNEPWSFCHLGYGEGVHAPGRCSDRAKCPEGDSATEQYLCGHNVLLAHAYTVQLYRENAARFNPSGSTQIGMTINIDYTYANSTKAEDIEAAQRFLEFLGKCSTYAPDSTPTPTPARAYTHVRANTHMHCAPISSPLPSFLSYMHPRALIFFPFFLPFLLLPSCTYIRSGAIAIDRGYRSAHLL